MGAHDGTELDRRNVRLDVVEPTAHRGVEGEVFDLDDKLARSGGRDLGIDVFPGGSVGKSCRAGGEAYLAVGHLSPSAKRIELEAGFNIGDGSRTGKSWMNRLTTMYVRSMSNVVEDAPGWFTRALAAPVETGSVEVEGASVHFRAWGPAGPGIVLIHGGAAHSRWWDHIAPQFAEGRRVVALDLTGHGDSDTRDAYAMSQWAREVLAAAEAGGIDGKPILVGHSMGGIVSFVASHLHGELLDGVVIIDSPLKARTPEEEAARRQNAFGPKKVYPTREDAMGRFPLRSAAGFGSACGA